MKSSPRLPPDRLHSVEANEKLMVATLILALICIFTVTAQPYGITFDAEKVKRLRATADPADVAQFDAYLRARRRTWLACCCGGRGSDISPVLNALELLGSLPLPSRAASPSPSS